MTVLRRILAISSARRLLDLSKAMAKKPNAASTSSENPVFEVWMKQESDLVQATAHAYGEHLVLEYALKQASDGVSRELQQLLQGVIRLYALDVVERELGNLLCEGFITPMQGQQVQQAKRDACKVLGAGNVWEILVSAFGIPEHMIAAPIASDWKKFNLTDNQGEIDGLGAMLEWQAKL